jgi:hypothetical protein
VAERLEQRPAQRVSQRSHGLRVGQVELQPIITRTRHILVLAGRIIVSPVTARVLFAYLLFARLLSARPIFGSHVSKDYSRKSRFDKSSKHFFREIPDRTGTRALPARSRDR